MTIIQIDERRKRRLEHELVRPAIERIQFGRFVLTLPILGDALVWRWPATVVHVPGDHDG
jgi:hypothetical protein